MGIRALNASERLRTIWTPEMDGYFIYLMLEQVGKGNRFDDHLFSKRAWKHMTSLFNAKFKFHYEKDVLKNRHKTLRNLYKIVKNLLDQKGFSWDEKRQMVTADNNVWDDYIKVHPDARSYRIKSIPCYSHLCTIYGNVTTEQKGDNVPELSLPTSENGTNSTTQPTDVGEILIDEYYDISISEKADEEALPNVIGTTLGSRSRTYWQPPMDHYFIELMLEQVRKGNRVDGVFTKQAWMEMIASFNSEFGFNYGMDILKNRYKTLRRQYNVIKNLLDLDGFAWDDTRQMVIADDCVWQDYIKAHTDARQFMTRPVPYYKNLCVICDPSADEKYCFLGLEQQNEVEQIKFLKMSNTSQSAMSVSSEDQVDEEQESTHADQKNKRQLENCSNSGHLRKLRRKDESMASALREMASAVSSLSDKKKDDDNSNSIPIENVIAAIQALPDMDEDLVLDACDFLEDEKKAKTFLVLDVKLRKKWLLRKLRPQQQE